MAKKSTQELSTSPQAVNERNAARYIDLSVAFLRAKRRDRAGSGPPFLRMGRAVRYRISDLDKWLESRLVGGGRER